MMMLEPQRGVAVIYSTEPQSRNRPASLCSAFERGASALRAQASRKQPSKARIRTCTYFSIPRANCRRADAMADVIHVHAAKYTEALVMN